MAEHLFYYEWDWARAEEHYKRALRLSPDYATARHWYTWFLCAMGRFEEAAEQIRRAQMLDPGSIVLHAMVGMPFYYRGDYRRAGEQFRRSLEMDAGFSHARYYLGSALAHSGEYEAAAAEFEGMIAADPIQRALGLLGYCYALSGRAGRAREVLTGSTNLRAGGTSRPTSAPSSTPGWARPTKPCAVCGRLSRGEARGWCG